MKKIIMVLLTAAVIALAAVSFYFYKNSDAYVMDNRINESQTELFSSINPDSGGENLDNLAEGRKINPQITAWITIPGSNIDFPVVQCEDNEYYLSHDFEKNESYMGVPFLDCRNSPDFSDFNSIIYGHNISTGFMFHQLLDFKNEEFFNSHSFGYLTLTDKKYKINFIACLIIESDEFVYDITFLSQSEKTTFLKTIEQKAVQFRDFNSKMLESEQLCTLSTCSYEFSNARTVLIGYLEELT